MNILKIITKIVCTFILISSCVMIDTNYLDNFEGRWSSTTLPFGNLAQEVELNIHNNNKKLEIIIDDKISYTGDCRVSNATLLIGWCIELNNINIFLIDATLTSDGNLLLRWKPLNFWYPYTTEFNPK